jgi:hypothetical protein
VSVLSRRFIAGLGIVALRRTFLLVHTYAFKQPETGPLPCISV